MKQLSGTGRNRNRALSRKIRESIPIPLFLAGGLNPHHIREAIDTVQPFGVDRCSGVRTAGQPDPQKLGAFFRAMGG